MSAKKQIDPNLQCLLCDRVDRRTRALGGICEQCCGEAVTVAARRRGEKNSE